MTCVLVLIVLVSGMAGYVVEALSEPPAPYRASVAPRPAVRPPYDWEAGE